MCRKVDPKSRLCSAQTKSKSLSMTLQASVCILNVKVHDSIIRKRLSQSGLFGRVAWRKPLLSKKNRAAWFRFEKLHLNNPHDFWNNALWTHETKVVLVGHNTQHHVWMCFVATEFGHLAVIELELLCLPETNEATCPAVKLD